ncbi:MAG: leucine-rich repeat domain-containing protein [Pseudomonadota bacterium]|nr:leucine-rich repeat domain-containing protein [Pseudomonadota bacterium]
MVFPKYLRSIGDYAFNACVRLESVFFNDGLVSIGNDAFRNCKALRIIHFPKDLLAIGDYAFTFCRRLETVFLSEGLESMGVGAFSHCTSLAYIRLPYGLRQIQSSTFYECSNLIYVNFPSTLLEISQYAFAFCENLELSVIFPYRLHTIGRHAFESCPLKQVTFPDSLKKIGAYAFAHACFITIALPPLLENLPVGVFSACKNLEVIITLVDLLSIDLYALQETWKLHTLLVSQSLYLSALSCVSRNNAPSLVVLKNVITYVDLYDWQLNFFEKTSYNMLQLVWLYGLAKFPLHFPPKMSEKLCKPTPLSWQDSLFHRYADAIAWSDFIKVIKLSQRESFLPSVFLVDYNGTKQIVEKTISTSFCEITCLSQYLTVKDYVKLFMCAKDLTLHRASNNANLNVSQCKHEHVLGHLSFFSYQSQEVIDKKTSGLLSSIMPSSDIYIDCNDLVTVFRHLSIIDDEQNLLSLFSVS